MPHILIIKLEFISIIISLYMTNNCTLAQLVEFWFYLVDFVRFTCIKIITLRYTGIKNVKGAVLSHSSFYIVYLLLIGLSPSVLRGVLFFILFGINRIYYFYVKPKNIFLLIISISLLINEVALYLYLNY